MWLSIDREKVIKGLQFCFATANCDGCPYEIERRKIPLKTPENHCPILDDILALLKEQEPQKVINRYANWDFELIGNCPKCNAVLHEFDNAKACGVCGQAVKRE